MTSDEIRRTFIEFFLERDHRRLPSASLIPAEFDPSALFTVAGMHPLKPYFLGDRAPAASARHDLSEDVPDRRHRDHRDDHRGISRSSRCSGNFSFGGLLQARGGEVRLGALTEGFGFPEEDIWITVFGGDEELGMDVDHEAIEAWLEVGVPRERIVECPRSENWWELPPPGPCGPCSELYLDRGLAFGEPDDLPGGENERFLEYWNLVFMQFDQNPANTLTPLPGQEHRHGPWAQPAWRRSSRTRRSVFETDQFAPLIALGEELSGRRYGEEFPTDRALRVLADHGRAMTFLIADGVVPSNEDRGYVLRRIVRRAIQQGRSLGLEPGFLGRYADLVTELMGSEYARAARAARKHPEVAELGGGELLPDARAGHPAARGAAGAGEAERARRASPRRTRSCSTTPTGSRST